MAEEKNCNKIIAKRNVKLWKAGEIKFSVVNSFGRTGGCGCLFILGCEEEQDSTFHVQGRKKTRQM